MTARRRLHTTSGPGRAKDPEPCDSYFGNVCSGFGGTLTCLHCGWDRFSHKKKKDS